MKIIFIPWAPLATACAFFAGAAAANEHWAACAVLGFIALCFLASSIHVKAPRHEEVVGAA